MKKTIKIFLFATLLGVTGSLSAQRAVKLGHIDSQELLKLMPERDSAQAKLQKAAAELETEMKTMQAELEVQYRDIVENRDKMSDLIRQSKEKKFQDMSMRAQEFQENAQKELAEKERTLLQPIIDRAKAAIADVAKENKYTYIFDAAGLLYHEDSDDILPMVKKKLGI